MTHAQDRRQVILGYEAGADLNVEVGRAIFGIKRFYSYDGRPWETGATDWPQYIPSGKPWRTHSIDAVALPRFSEEAGAAMAVLQQWPEEWDVYRRHDETYRVTLYRDAEATSIVAEAPSWELAACRAALLAVAEARSR